MTEAGYSAVSPVFTVDGNRVPALARDCIRLEIDEGIEGLRTMEGEFLAVGGDATGPPAPMYHLDGSTVDFGRRLQIALGPDGRQRNVFDGMVSALEAVFGDGDPPVVLVLAEDALMRLRLARRMRTYTESSDADIASQIAGDHGLSADVDADGPSYDVVQQLNQSDLAFLRDRARLIRAELWCTGSTLHFRSRPKREGTALTLTQGEDLISSRICADLAHQRTSVVISGYDAAAKSSISERAESDVLDAEITGGRSGVQLVGQALGTATTYRVREAALTSQEASAWARAELLRRGRRFVTAEGLSDGSPDLVVGSRLRLQRVGAPFEGDGYYVTRVTHTFDLTRGFRTRFEAERPTINEVR